MPANRCTICSINFPTGEKQCPACGEKLWHVPNHEPDKDWVEKMREATPLAERDAEADYAEWLHDELVSLGFSAAQRRALKRHRVSPAEARELISRGAPHDTVVAILAE